MTGAARATIVELLVSGPLAEQWRLVRPLASDELGPCVLAEARKPANGRAGGLVVARAFAADDDAWPNAAARLEALAAIRHKKISSLLAFGRHGRTGWVVHEHDDGRSLVEHLDERGPLALAELVPVASQILMGVGDAHQRGLVVGGVRPRDVTLHEDAGRALLVKLRSFGLGAVVGLSLRPIGNADEPSDFRAPEADPMAEPTSDVFSLAALFLRLCSGPLPPFTTPAKRGAELRARIELVQRSATPLPDGLVELLHRALDPDPAGRPYDANQLVEELIDAVPMSAFRLPRAGEEPTRDLTGAKAGQSSMMLFTGRWKDVAERKAGRPPADRHGEPDVAGGEDEPASTGVERLPALSPTVASAAAVGGSPATSPRRRHVAWMVAAGALTLVGIAVAVSLPRGTPLAAQAAAPAAEASVAPVAAAAIGRADPPLAVGQPVAADRSPPVPAAASVPNEPRVSAPASAPVPSTAASDVTLTQSLDPPAMAGEPGEPAAGSGTGRRSSASRRHPGRGRASSGEHHGVAPTSAPTEESPRSAVPLIGDRPALEESAPTNPLLPRSGR